MKWFKKKTDAGKYRLEDEHGVPLIGDDDRPIEFEDGDAPTTASASASIEPSTLVQGEPLKPDPAIGELQTALAGANAKVEKLTGLVEQLLAANTRSIDDRAQALADDLVRSGKIVPAEADGVKATFAALAKVDAEQGDGSDLAGDYAKRLGGTPGHGWSSEVVAPGRQHSNAALGGLDGLVAAARQGASGGSPMSQPQSLSGNRRVLDPGEGTERVGGGKPDPTRLTELLAMTDAGREALGRLERGEVNLRALKHQAGLA